MIYKRGVSPVVVTSIGVFSKFSTLYAIYCNPSMQKCHLKNEEDKEAT